MGDTAGCQAGGCLHREQPIPAPSQVSKADVSSAQAARLLASLHIQSLHGKDLDDAWKRAEVPDKGRVSHDLRNE